MNGEINFINVSHDTHFYFDIENLPIDALIVRKFSTVANGILTDTTFLIEVLSTTHLQEDVLLECSAMLHIRWFNQDVYHRGIISKIVFQGGILQYYSYQFTLSSLLHTSRLTAKNCIFIQTTVQQLVNNLISDYKIPQLRLTWNLKNVDYPLDDQVQYCESDWDFINRILRIEGLGFIWQHNKDYSELIFFDDLKLLPNLPGHSNISYVTLSNQAREEESIWNFSAQGKWLTDHLQFFAESDCMGFSPGLGFALEHHPQKNYNRGYRLLSVQHFGQQATEIDKSPNASMGYYNKILCIADDEPYHPELPAVPQCAQFFTAKVSGLPNDVPWLDNQGRYRVNVDFDQEHAGKTTYLMPMMQPYNSLGAGWHFPLRDKTEVLVSCLDGDLRRPIILGALPNSDSQPSVHQFSYYQHNIITKLGSRFSFIDDPQNLQAFLSTPENLNRLHMQAKSDHDDRIELVSEQGDITISAKKQLTRESQSDHNQIINGCQKITVAKNYQIISKQKNIRYQSGKSLQQKSQKDLLLHAEQNPLQLSAKQNVAIKANNHVQLTVKQNDAQLSSLAGSIHINAAKNLLIKGQNQGPITLQQNQTTIQHTTDNTTLLTAKNITIKANNINIHSNNVLHNNTATTQASGVGRDVDISQAEKKSSNDQTDNLPDNLTTENEKSEKKVTNNLAANEKKIQEHCNNTPTPAPERIIGKCEYYQFRYDDFVKRHNGCTQHQAPSYYLNYGLKYCNKFSVGLYPKLSPAGKEWLPKARLLLQQYMEAGLAKANHQMSIAYVDTNQPIANELNDKEFKDFAFHTHIKSYWEAGLKNLPHEDIKKIAKTLDDNELIDPETWNTGWPLGIGYTTDYLEKHVPYEKQRKEIYEICKIVTGVNDEVCIPEK